MVRNLKIKNVIENYISQETQEIQETPTTAPEPEEHVNTPIETEVAVFEATHELPPEAANFESAATVVESTTPKAKRPPRKKKATTATPATADPPTPPPEPQRDSTSKEVEPDPPAPEVEHPAEEIKIAAKAKAKPRAKPKAKPVPTQGYPTHDDEGQRIRPPPSMERPTKPETPE